VKVRVGPLKISWGVKIFEDNKEIKKALASYCSILEGKSKPRFKLLNQSRLNEKIKNAYDILESCELCEHKCRVNRLDNKLGLCQLTDKIWISSYFTHFGEEPMISPSFTVFFMSCNFSCQYCQNWTISQRIEKGEFIGERELAEIIDKHSDCRNVNFVGGSPTPQLAFILKTLSYLKSDIPVVWNSNFFMSEKSMGLLKNTVDVYLTDFKYGNDKCAKRLSKIDNYLDIVKRNHLLAFKDSELIIRHLVLPNHFSCCTKPILDFIAENFRDMVLVNLMDQYRPEYMAREYPDINRALTREEFNKAVEYAKKLGLNFIT